VTLLIDMELVGRINDARVKTYFNSIEYILTCHI
jgi:hypothetical protein